MGWNFVFRVLEAGKVKKRPLVQGASSFWELGELKRF